MCWAHVLLELGVALFTLFGRHLSHLVVRHRPRLLNGMDYHDVLHVLLVTLPGSGRNAA